MAIITVTYARLWNLGNYENERLEAVATVENDAATAFAEAIGAVNEQHATMEAERRAERQRLRDKYERKEDAPF